MNLLLREYWGQEPTVARLNGFENLGYFTCDLAVLCVDSVRVIELICSELSFGIVVDEHARNGIEIVVVECRGDTGWRDESSLVMPKFRGHVILRTEAVSTVVVYGY